LGFSALILKTKRHQDDEAKGDKYEPKCDWTDCSFCYRKFEEIGGGVAYSCASELEYSVQKSCVGLLPLSLCGLSLVEEVQGSTQDVARHKCRQAAEIVCGGWK